MLDTLYMIVDSGKKSVKKRQAGMRTHHER